MDYWMGSIEDFINEMNTNWWVKEKRKTDKISENIGCDILEDNSDPADVAENKWFVWDLSVNQSAKCEHKVKDKAYRYNLERKSIELIEQLSIDPNGSTLPHHKIENVNPRKYKGYLKNWKQRNPRKHNDKIIIKKYKLKNDWRVLWHHDIDNEFIYIIALDQKTKLNLICLID